MKRFFACLIFIALFLPFMASAATYYVSTAGNDNNAGNMAAPYRTIQRCANLAQAGDTCYVRQGTYDEQVTLRRNGSVSEGFINFAGYPLDDAKPVMRGFVSVYKGYIRIIGFEMTHDSTAYTHAIGLYASHHFEILNNYIHHINGQAIRNNMYYGFSNYTVIRGNTIYYMGCVPGISGACQGHNAIVLNGAHNLIEYNNISRVQDFIDTDGGHNIHRNNLLYDARDSYWPDCTPDAAHMDSFQPFGIQGYDPDHNIFESNWASDNLEANSHFMQIRDETESGEKEFIVRGNVAFRFGSGIGQAGAIDYLRMYSNTFSDFSHIYPDERKAWSVFGFNTEHETDGSTNNHLFNNIFYRVTRPDTRNIIYVDSLSSATMSNNACEHSGTHASCSVTSSISFADYANDNFQLQPSSSARNAGKAITTVTSSTGSGSSFNVVDANFFIDGFGIAEGDIIKVGSNNPVRISSISGNTIIVDRSISWNSGDGVYWRNQDSQPDIGAFEYNPEGYDYDLTITSPADGSGVSGQVSIIANPVNPPVIRFVIFYIDGIPFYQDFESPYTYTWDSSGQPDGSFHTIEARAYPLYASTKLSAGQKITLAIGSGTPLEPVPGDLNGDRRVDISDLVIIATSFGRASGSSGWNSNYDVAQNGVIDIADLVYVARRYTG